MNRTSFICSIVRRVLIPAMLTVSVPGVAFAEDEGEVQLTQNERMQWWREARFGMFIHWGLYSILGGEWNGRDYGKECGGFSAEWVMNKGNIPPEEYSKLAKQFNPVKFNAKEWVSLAKEAGMKYMVITSKHHDGFCLFDTEHTDYDIMDAAPFKRDIIKELADECAKQGIKFGVYYSQFKDWYHKGLRWKGTMSGQEYLDMVQGHLIELLTNYGEMSVLWFDLGGGNIKDANSQGAMVRKLQPHTVICSRLYNRNVPRPRQKYADFESLPDRTVATARMSRDTETCMTMRHNWGYDRDDNNWKSTKDIIECLVLSASRGVNFLLNVGPMPEGTLCPEEIERFKAIGKWMKVNGDSIYGTTYGPLEFDFPWGCMTMKGKNLYLHVFKWDPKGISFNGIKNKPSRAFLLADVEKEDLVVEHDSDKNITTVKVPAEAPDENDSVIVLEFENEIQVDDKATGKYHWSKSTGLEEHKPRKKRKRNKQ